MKEAKCEKVGVFHCLHVYLLSTRVGYVYVCMYDTMTDGRRKKKLKFYYAL